MVKDKAGKDKKQCHTQSLQCHPQSEVCHTEKCHEELQKCYKETEKQDTQCETHDTVTNKLEGDTTQVTKRKRKVKRKQTSANKHVLDVPCVDSAQTVVNMQGSIAHVQIQGTKVAALIDTGAIKASCIAHSLYQRLDLDKTVKCHKSSISAVRGVGGTLVPIVGEAEIPLQLGPVCTKHKFYILQSMNYQVILGMDFLDKHVSQIDLEGKRLVLKEDQQQVNLFQIPETYIAQLTNTVSIPPRSEVVVPVVVRQMRGLDQDQVMFSPTASLAARKGVAGACALAHIREGQSVFRILNPLDVEVKIRKGYPVAKGSTLIDSSVSKVELKSHTSEVNTAEPADDQPELSDDYYVRVAEDLGFTLEDAAATAEEKRQLQILIGKNRDIFAKDLSELGNAKVPPHKIDTGDARPIRMPPYRVNPDKKSEIDRQVKEMRDADIIEPSISEWQAPVVLVKKKDNKWRFAVDYRQLNKVTQPISQPLPKLDDIFDQIGHRKAKIFSSLDLASGFWQIPLESSTAEKTAFVTHGGVYQFRKLPFGLRNSPSAFSMAMNHVLRNLTFDFAVIYVDDILVYSSSMEQHLEHLSEVFSRLRAADLRLKPSKCKFLSSKIPYLGHMISSKGVEMEKAKIEAVLNFPRPHNVRSVKSFLGLCNYYRRFVKGFCHITRPLNALTQKDVDFIWSDSCEEAFQSLKKALTSEPILLVYPNFDKEFILSTDASDTAIGFVLGQKDDQGRERVIAYGGKSLDKHQRNWAIRDKELLAIMEGIKHYETYLTTEKPFTVYTDHQSLQRWKTMKPDCGRVSRWLDTLQLYNLNIVYRKGESNGNADALSRIDHEEVAKDEDKHEDRWINTTSLSEDIHEDPVSEPGETVEYYLQAPTVNTVAIEQLKPEDAEKISDNLLNQDTLAQVLQTTAHSTDQVRELQEKDPDFGPILRYLQDTTLPESDKEARAVIVSSDYYSLDHDTKLLYHCSGKPKTGKREGEPPQQLAVPKELRDDLLRSYHDSLAGGGHQGTNRVYQAIRQKYFWKSMMRDINCYVGSCITCQQAKRHYGAKPAPLHPIPPTNIFSRMHVDILGPLPTSTEGYKYILLFVDSFSKWCEAFPLKTADAATVAKHLYEDIICRYGAPDSLVSDRGRQFMSKLINEISKLFQITRCFTSSYHPQSNSTCERMNSTIEKTLKAYIDKDQKNWPSILPSVMMAYRISPCTESTHFSPYYMLFGKECRRPIDVALTPPTNMGRDATDYITNLQERKQVTLDLAKENILKAQDHYKAHHDKKAQDPGYTVGQAVWLHSSRTPAGSCPKLIKRWTGPYYIAEVHDKSTYKLHKQEDHRPMQSLIHANRLKPYNDPDERPTNPPELPDDEVTDAPPDPEIPETGIQDAAASTDSQRQEVSDTDQARPGPDPDKGHTTGEQNPNMDRVEKIPEVKSIISFKKVNGLGWYKVNFTDKSQKPREVRDYHLPKRLRNEFHAVHQNNGRKRKKGKKRKGRK